MDRGEANVEATVCHHRAAATRDKSQYTGLIYRLYPGPTPWDLHKFIFHIWNGGHLNKSIHHAVFCPLFINYYQKRLIFYEVMPAAWWFQFKCVTSCVMSLCFQFTSCSISIPSSCVPSCLKLPPSVLSPPLWLFAALLFVFLVVSL